MSVKKKVPRKSVEVKAIEEQEQLTVYERFTPNGLQRWARSKDGKTIELPMIHFIDGRSPFVFFQSPPDDFWNMPAEPEKTVHLLNEENR